MSEKKVKNKASKTDPEGVGVDVVVIPPNTKLYMVCAVQKQQVVELRAYNIRQELPLIWADGMLGVLPVFNSKEKAETFANGKCDVWEVVSSGF